MRHHSRRAIPGLSGRKRLAAAFFGGPKRFFKRARGLGMQISTRTEGQRAVLRLSGRFEFSAHREFREAADRILLQDGIDEVVVDLMDVDYVDSSALGMLLMLRERANGAKLGLVLAKPRGMVRQALDIAHFEKLFTIT
jgi:anti-anti-sigma factor